jgi:hypothetical protein
MEKQKHQEREDFIKNNVIEGFPVNKEAINECQVKTSHSDKVKSITGLGTKGVYKKIPSKEDFADYINNPPE